VAGQEIPEGFPAFFHFPRLLAPLSSGLLLRDALNSGHSEAREDAVKHTLTTPTPTADPPLTAKEAAAAVGLSLGAFWRAVASNRLPLPVYPLPRAPRWFASELREALDALRQKPTEAKAERRAAQLARIAA
jgi:predicted DNA-binding transcriptional regulator AlpA